MLDPGADLARRARQRRRDPGLQVFLLLAVHLAGAATGLETRQPFPNFNTMIRKPEYFQSVANARRVVSTTGRGSRASSHWVDVSASASRMLGGRATPTAWKARPTSPVTGVLSLI